MNIKLNNSAMGGSSSPKLSDSSSPGIWDTFGGLFGCREVAIVDRLNCRAKKPLQRGGHIRDKAIIEVWPLQKGGCSRQVAIVQTIGFCRLVSIVERGGHCKELVIVERWPLQRGGHCCCTDMAVVERWPLWRGYCYWSFDCRPPSELLMSFKTFKEIILILHIIMIILYQ